MTRILNKGAICQMNAKEMLRQEKWRQHNMLKVRNRQLAKENKNETDLFQPKNQPRTV